MALWLQIMLINKWNIPHSPWWVAFWLRTSHNLLIICVMDQFSHYFLYADPFNLWPQLQQPQASAHSAPTDTAVSHL